jgi:hypothetical protein
MSLRFTVCGLATALFLCSTVAPRAYAEPLAPKGRLAVPITGSVADGGTFNGTLIVHKFAIRNAKIVAVGAISGVATAAGSTRTGLQAMVELPVTVSDGAAPGGRVERQSHVDGEWGRPAFLLAQTCGVLHVEIGPHTIDLLGLIVALDPIVLDISGDSAGVLGNLVCQALALLNNIVGLIGILNLILGLLTGLLGGLAV